MRGQRHAPVALPLEKQAKSKAGPLQAWSGPEGSRKLGFPHFVTTAQPYAPAAFTPRKCSWYSFLLEAESTPGREWKNPLTPAGIEPATFRFVAQHLNHCATAVLFPGKRPRNYYTGVGWAPGPVRWVRKIASAVVCLTADALPLWKRVPTEWDLVLLLSIYSISCLP